MNVKKTGTILVAAILVAALLIGCGGSSNSYTEDYGASTAASSAAPAAMAPEMARGSAAGFASDKAAYEVAVTQEAQYDGDVAEDVEEDDMEPPTGGVAGPQANRPVDPARKIIRNVDLTMQTLSFDRAVDDISKIADSYGGYVQNSYVEGLDMYNERGTRTATFSLRVPAEKLDAFVNSFGGSELFHITSKSQNSDDITESYFDSKARLDALKVQEERLISMLEGATELEYMLQVEKELMNVRYEIESLTSQLQRMDSYVAMSTVNITLYEVIKYEPVENVPITFGERVSRAFASSWENFSDFSGDFTIGFIEAFPFLLLLAAIVVVVILLIRRNNRRFAARLKARHAAMQSPPPEAPKPAEPQEPNQ